MKDAVSRRTSGKMEFQHIFRLTAGRRRTGRKAAAFGTALFGALALAGCSGADPAREEYRLAGIEQLEAGDYEAAIQSFEEAIAHSDGRVGDFEVDVLKYRAEAEYKAEDYGAASHTYDVLLEVEGKDADLYYLRCMALAAEGQTAQAQEDFDAASAMAEGKKEASPVMDDALVALGTAYQKSGDPERAKTAFDKALALGTATPELYGSLGLALLEGGQPAEAAEYFSQGMALAQPGSEEYGSLLRNRAAALESGGEFSQALELLKQYTASYGSDPEVEREIRFLETR